MSVLGVSYRSYRVWQRNRDVVFRLWFAELIPPLFGPLIMMSALGLGLGVFVDLEGGDTYLAFLTPGIMSIFPMMWAMFDCGWGAYGRMNMQGVYDAVIATPLNVEDVIAGEVLFGSSRAMLQGVHILIAAALFTPAYDVIQSPLAIFAIPVALLTGLIFGSIAMSFTAYAPSMSAYNFMFAFIINPMFWFSGAFYPLESLPSGFQALAYFLPITHIVALNRGLLSGDVEWSHLGNLAAALAYAALFFSFALWSMRRRLVK